MRNLRQLIDKSHDLGLEHLCVFSKMSDISESENCISALTLDHRIKFTLSGHIRCDNSRASFTESESQQVANLGNSGLE